MVLPNGDGRAWQTQNSFRDTPPPVQKRTNGIRLKECPGQVSASNGRSTGRGQMAVCPGYVHRVVEIWKSSTEQIPNAATVPRLVKSARHLAKLEIVLLFTNAIYYLRHRIRTGTMKLTTMTTESI